MKVRSAKGRRKVFAYFKLHKHILTHVVPFKKIANTLIELETIKATVHIVHI